MQEGTVDTPLRERLAALDGVDRVLVDDERRVICLILRQNADSESTLAEAQATAASDFHVEVAFPPDLRERQRVRFIDIQREQTENHVSVHVTLEWGGTQHRGTATGERAGPIEIRTAAAATLQALGFFLPDGVPLRLAGVKQVKAFDADMIVVSVHRTGSEPRNLVGAVIMGPDPLRASAVAVLSALNRLLGNYLARL